MEELKEGPCSFPWFKDNKRATLISIAKEAASKLGRDLYVYHLFMHES